MKLFSAVTTGLITLFMPLLASAHVKWFVDYDTTKAPESLSRMLSAADFWLLAMLSIVVIYLTSCLDRKWLSPVDRVRWQPHLSAARRVIPSIMRYGSSAFFLTLAIGFPHIILTPELVVNNPWLRHLHWLIGLTAFHRRSSFIAGLGIIFLYCYAIQLYGTFHMMDYVVFVGTAVYLIMQSVRAKGVQGIELELLRLTLCCSFIWGGIEKFLQPELFYQLLNDHAYLAMGLDWGFFIRATGFVEICCAWHIFSGRLAGYAGIGVLAFVVLAAVIPFGTIDFIGHFLFVIPLMALLLAPRQKPLFKSAEGNTAAFVLMTVTLITLAYLSYYLLHYHLHSHLH